MARTKAKAQTKPDVLELRYVALSTVVGWERNPKKHDVGAVWQSIQKHGFRDPMAFDSKLNDGRGGIVEGNGRSHVLKEMMLAKEAAPRGIVAGADGEWMVPVLFGVDAESERAAEAYGVDHNNLVLSGGDFSNVDIAKLWDETPYAALLADLAQFEELPISVDGEDVDDLIARIEQDGEARGEANSPEREKQHCFGVLLPCDGEGEQAEMFKRLRDEGYDVVLHGTKPRGVKR